jgi:hypothetical protein
VAGEPQPQIDIHKAVSRLFVLFFSSYDETIAKLGLVAEGLTESVLHLNLEIFCFVLFCFYFGYFLFLFFFPFEETTTEFLLRHQQQDWRLKD